MASLGSDAWLGAEEYENHEELYERAITFFASVNWGSLARHASTIRNGVGCHLSGKYSLGHFNLVRRIIFEDGVNWIARLRLPQVDMDEEERGALDRVSAMRLEMATANYIGMKTDIPVPQIHGYNLDTNNEVGAPYMFMQYINGTVASNLKGDIGVFGSPSQNEHFWKQMASIHVQLASLEFDQIGGIYQEGDTFTIGPELVTGLGPFKSGTDYYVALADHVREEAKKSAPPEFLGSSARNLPNLFLMLIGVYRVGKPNGPFGLANRDFGAHNVLVDDDLNIVGLIDFDGVMAAPIEMIAQFPEMMGLDRPIPGHVETLPLAIEREQKVAPFFDKYVGLMKSSIAETGIGEDMVKKVADSMMSEAASMVQGLVAYEGYSTWLAADWLAAYERLFVRREELAASNVDEGIESRDFAADIQPNEEVTTESQPDREAKTTRMSRIGELLREICCW